MERRSFLRRVAVVAAGAVATVKGAAVFAKEPEAAPATAQYATGGMIAAATANAVPVWDMGTSAWTVNGPLSGQGASTLHNDRRLTEWCDGFVDETVQAMGMHTHAITVPHFMVRGPFDDGAGSFVSPSPLTRHGAYLRG